MDNSGNTQADYINAFTQFMQTGDQQSIAPFLHSKYSTKSYTVFLTHFA